MSDVNTDNSAAATAVQETPAPVVSKLTHIPGGRPDLDQVGREVAAEAAAAGVGIRFRVDLALNVPGGNRQYRGWLGNRWKGEIRDEAELRRFRDDLNGFINGWFAASK